MSKIRVSTVLHGFLLAIILASLLALVFPSSIARADTVVNFPDPNLKAAIWSQLGRSPPVGDIHQSDLVGLTTLSAENKGITILTGLEHCTSLTSLDLRSNQIGNISVLSGLTSLTGLDLGSNQIGDISPLSGLTSLTGLILYANQIGNISPLSGLTSLTYLYLYANQIGNISPLSGLTSLTDLRLGSNQIGNISPLSGLTSLTGLDLGLNQIGDISPLSGLTSLTYLSLSLNQIVNVEPLVNNPGLAQGDTVDLTSNPLSSTSIGVYIPQLQGRGVQVLYDVPTGSTPVAGITREVNGNILPGVSITLDGAGLVLSDQYGQYGIMATSTGSHTIVAHKDGFRNRTQNISIAGLGQGYAVPCNFQGNQGLIPNAPNMTYALACINRWLYPPNADTGLTMMTALAVINAWLYPIQ